MRIHKRVIIDIATGKVETQDSYDYYGPVALCKESRAERDARRKEARREKQITASQLERRAFTDVIQSLGIDLDELQGLTAKERAALVGRALQGVSTRFQDIGARVKTALSRRGVLGANQPASGDFARSLLNLGVAEESERFRQLSGIDLEDARLRRERRRENIQARLGAAGFPAQEVDIFTRSGDVALSGRLGVEAARAGQPSIGEQLAGAAVGAGVGLATRKIGEKIGVA